MKKLLLLVAILCSMSMNVKAEPEELTFVVEVIGTGGTAHPLPKSPVNPPQATLDDHVLTFTTSHADYTLTLLDVDGEAVYTTYVSSSVNVVVLPATLTGNYELRLTPNASNYYFYGEISL